LPFDELLRQFAAALKKKVVVLLIAVGPLWRPARD
jgi:hypothetical protein